MCNIVWSCLIKKHSGERHLCEQNHCTGVWGVAQAAPVCCCLPGVSVTQTGPGSCCPGQGGERRCAGQVSGTGDGLFQARPWVSSQSSHLSELSPKACGHPPAEPHARLFWQAQWPWKSSYPGQQVQVYESPRAGFCRSPALYDTQRFATTPDSSAAPRGEAPGALGRPGSGLVERAKLTLPWKAFAPEQNVAFILL